MTSFGEYYDAQLARLRKDLDNKNAQLWKEWEERHDKSNRHSRKELQENS